MQFSIRVYCLIGGCLATMSVAAGCLDSAMGKRMREAFAPQFITGLTADLPTDENGASTAHPLEQAIIDALGAMIVPRTSAVSDISSDP